MSSYYWVLIGSHICHVDWHNNRWPWVTLNDRFTISAVAELLVYCFVNESSTSQVSSSISVSLLVNSQFVNFTLLVAVFHSKHCSNGSNNTTFSWAWRWVMMTWEIWHNDLQVSKVNKDGRSGELALISPPELAVLWNMSTPSHFTKN